MVSTFTLRNFIGSDVPHLIHIWNSSLQRDPTTEARFVSWLLGDPNFASNEQSGMFVAVDASNKPLGFIRATIRHVPNETLGIEEDFGFIPVIAVDPAMFRKGIGTALLSKAMEFFKQNNRKMVFVSGKTGSAPGYVFPGVDINNYGPALQLFKKMGFTVDHEAVSMLGIINEMDLPLKRKTAHERATDIIVSELAPCDVPAFFEFLTSSFPGDWNSAARLKISSGKLGEVLIAKYQGKVVGYCQWEGEHFGPFGVCESVRNKGVGAKLFLEAAYKIQQADGRSVWFNWADPDAERFYTRQGLHSFRKFAILTCKLADIPILPKPLEAASNVPQKQKHNILIIGAHIGDAEITGGLLATKYASMGHKVTFLHLTAGEKGNPAMDAQKYREQRIVEAHTASKLMGAQNCIVLKHPDGELQACQETFLEVCDIIRDIRPDIIFSHWRGSFHRDHRAAYQIAMEGSFLAALPGIVRTLPAHVVRGLYYLENWEDLEEYHPDFWVSIDDKVFSTWVAACETHQLLRGEVSFSYLQYYKGLAAKHGAEISTKYAVCVSLPPISRKRKVDLLPVDTEPVLIF